MSKRSEDDFINFMNDLYYQNIDDMNTLQKIYDYKIKSNNTKDELLKWLNNDKLIFKHSEREYIIGSAIQLIKNELDGYDDYVSKAKEYLYADIMTDKISSTKLIDHQFKNLYYKEKGRYNILEPNLYYDVTDFEKIINNDKEIKTIPYLMKTKKGFGPTLIFYSYICYFKCAVNCIVHHPLFKKHSNTDSEQIPEFELYDKNKRYTFAEYLQIGGSKLWELLKTYKDIIDVVEFYNITTKHTYLIGRPGVKYYPHQILQELLYYLHNDFAKEFYCNKYFVKIIDEPVINMEQRIYEILNECNLKSVFIAPILDDPLKNYVLPIGTKNEEIKYEFLNEKKKAEENHTNPKSIASILKNYTKITIKDAIDNNKIYQYKYFMNDYYLTSFCVAENIPEKNISFHCVFIQIKYDYDFNIVGINRYDDNKIDYFNKEDQKNNEYLQYEHAIFHKDFISDYYDKNHNYKICLLCYSKRTVRSNEY